MRRLIALLAALAVMSGLAVAVAPQVQASTIYHTLAQDEAKMDSITVGPNVNTDWGAANFTGTWVSYISCTDNKKHWYGYQTFSNHTPTAPVHTASAAKTASGTVKPMATCQPDRPVAGMGITPMCSAWYDPFCWNWSAIWGSIWNQIQNCINGTSHAVLGTMGANAASAALTEGAATLELTPQGVAILAIGACISNLAW